MTYKEAVDKFCTLFDSDGEHIAKIEFDKYVYSFTLYNDFIRIGKYLYGVHFSEVFFIKKFMKEEEIDSIVSNVIRNMNDDSFFQKLDSDDYSIL